MSVQLRYCERCGVIIPVDMAKTPGPMVCDNCLVLGEGRTPPRPVQSASRASRGGRPPSGGGSGGGPIAPPDPSALAATAPVLRPPTARDFEAEEARQRAVAMARRRSARATAIGAIAVLLPLILGGVVLTSTMSGLGFATRGAPGEALERLGEIGVQGVEGIRGLLVGETRRAGDPAPVPGADPRTDPLDDEPPLANEPADPADTADDDAPPADDARPVRPVGDGDGDGDGPGDDR